MTGDRVERSLTGLLEDADGLRAIDDTTPGATVALLEYLLAICYASGTYPVTDAEWQDWAEHGHSLAKAATWLAEQPDGEWDLFHPTEPLGQNALLAPFLDQHGAGPAQLVIERVGDYNQFFDHHHLEHPTPLPAAEAFRAMLTQHVYGPTGRARISGKETLGPTITNLAIGRLSSRIRVVALGSTLGETLRLNLTPWADGPGEFNRSWTAGTTERRGFRTKPDGRPVSGPADLHSYLGRSILLRPAAMPETGEPVVDRVLVGAGELLALRRPQLQDVVYASTAEGKTKPLWASRSRAFWRDAHALYAAVKDARKPDDARQSANLYERLARFPRPDDSAGPDHPPVREIKLWAVGLVAKQTTVISWVTGVYPFAPGLGATLHRASKDGSQIAEYVATSLGKAAYAAWEIAYPNPKPSDKAGQIARFDVRWQHWEASEDPFNLLLAQTATGVPVDECLLDYASTLASNAAEFLAKSLDSLPRNARGFQARAAALRRFESELASRKAPAQLQGEEE
ncbi:type I-E CRISPR-associated protein Cse1/CasA [Streptomyces goshikiensis]|uniref:type I-E CRISPR-associated protein Cse1/CasA n=1 Tax=Streptomyces goshikiensis TaxID=1942 RepID=UPI003689177B